MVRLPARMSVMGFGRHSDDGAGGMRYSSRAVERSPAGAVVAGEDAGGRNVAVPGAAVVGVVGGAEGGRPGGQSVADAGAAAGWGGCQRTQRPGSHPASRNDRKGKVQWGRTGGAEVGRWLQSVAPPRRTPSQVSRRDRRTGGRSNDRFQACPGAGRATPTQSGPIQTHCGESVQSGRRRCNRWRFHLQ